MSALPELLDVLSGPVLETAPRLLGSVLRHGDVSVRITEVEAYDGGNDPGSHAFRGQTPRNATMFGPAGHLYVYFSYGMHHCCNVVCGPEGVARAVLLRAGEVVTGTPTARSRRGDVPASRLARGPACLCQALGIDRTQDGASLSGSELELTIAEQPERRVRTGPRVGLRNAGDWPWRFWIDGDPTVSAYRPAARRHHA